MTSKKKFVGISVAAATLVSPVAAMAAEPGDVALADQNMTPVSSSVQGGKVSSADGSADTSAQVTHLLLHLFRLPRRLMKRNSVPIPQTRLSLKPRNRKQTPVPRLMLHRKHRRKPSSRRLMPQQASRLHSRR